MSKLPVSPLKVASLVGEVRDLSRGPSRVLVLGYDERDAAEVTRALRGERPQAGEDSWQQPLVDTLVLGRNGGFPRQVFADAVAVTVIVASAEELSSAELKDGMLEMSHAEKPLVVVLKDAPGIEIEYPGVGPSRIVGMSGGGIKTPSSLLEAVVDAAGDRAVALAAAIPAIREEACRQIIRKAARQNAVIGILFVIPGADMPVMTINEARMILRLAVVHGESVGAERALELLGVVGAGFGFRALARQALDFLPGPGWIIKGAVAWSGTRAMGAAAKAYFGSGARLTPSRLSPLAERLKRLRG